MDVFARLVSLDICAMNPCAPRHALKDMVNASLASHPPRYVASDVCQSEVVKSTIVHIKATYFLYSRTQFANVNLVGKATTVACAHLTLAVQLVHRPMVLASFPTNASALTQPTLSATFTKKATSNQIVH